MGFCTDEEHKRFLKLCPEVERYIVGAGIQLSKIWLEVNKEQQARRMAARLANRMTFAIGTRLIAFNCFERNFRHSGAVPYDHTSIIATLRKRFPQLGRPLTARDAAAPDLESVLALPKPDNRGPPRIKALPYAPAAQTAAAAQTKPLNSLQRALVGFAANLPETSGKNLQAHLASIQARPRQPPPGTTDNVHAARTYVKKQVQSPCSLLDLPRSASQARWPNSSSNLRAKSRNLWPRKTSKAYTSVRLGELRGITKKERWISVTAQLAAFRPRTMP